MKRVLAIMMVALLTVVYMPAFAFAATSEEEGEAVIEKTEKQVEMTAEVSNEVEETLVESNEEEVLMTAGLPDGFEETLIGTEGEGTLLFAGKVQITLDANGGTFKEGATSTKTVETNDKGKLDGPKLPNADKLNAPADSYLIGWSKSDSATSADVTKDTVFDAATTIYAVWGVEIKSTVTFDANGGTFKEGGATTKTATTETNGTVKDIPNGDKLNAKEGCYFVGWSKSDSATSADVDKNTVFEDDTTVYAVWAEPAEVTFDYNDGVTPSVKRTAEKDGKLKKENVPAAPTGSKGWYTAATGGTKANFEGAEAMKFTSDTTLYAQYPATVTFHYDGKTENKTADPATDLVTDAPTPTEPDFYGWYDAATGGNAIDLNNYKFTEDADVYAHYGEAYAITVTDDGNGTGSAIPMAEVGATVTLTATPNKGYAFKEWTSDDVTVSKDGTFVMPDKPVTVKANFGEGRTLMYKHMNQLIDITDDSGQVYVTVLTTDYIPKVPAEYEQYLDEYTDVAYNIGGHNKGPQWDFSKTVAENLAQTGVEMKDGVCELHLDGNIIHKFKVHFVPNGGTPTPADQTGTVDTDTLTEPNDVVKEGYTLEGWYTDEGLTDEWDFNDPWPTKGESYLYAKWAPNSYTIHFDSSEGEGTMEDLPMTFGAAKNLTSNKFTKEGFVFAGWSLTEGGTTVDFKDAASVKNLTSEDNGVVNLYAVWTPVEDVEDEDTPEKTVETGDTNNLIAWSLLGMGAMLAAGFALRRRENY